MEYSLLPTLERTGLDFRRRLAAVINKDWVLVGVVTPTGKEKAVSLLQSPSVSINVPSLLVTGRSRFMRPLPQFSLRLPNDDVNHLGNDRQF